MSEARISRERGFERREYVESGETRERETRERRSVGIVFVREGGSEERESV